MIDAAGASAEDGGVRRTQIERIGAGPSAGPRTRTPAPALKLQRAIGNKAVGQVLARPRQTGLRRDEAIARYCRKAVIFWLNNPDADFNGLNRMGDDGSGNGLKFDTGFEADYWIGFTNGNNPVQVFSNAAVLRTDGRLLTPNLTGSLDYGSFDGGNGTQLNSISALGVGQRQGFVISALNSSLQPQTLQARVVCLKR